MTPWAAGLTSTLSVYHSVKMSRKFIFISQHKVLHYSGRPLAWHNYPFKQFYSLISSLASMIKTSCILSGMWQVLWDVDQFGWVAKGAGISHHLSFCAVTICRVFCICIFHGSSLYSWNAFSFFFLFHMFIVIYVGQIYGGAVVLVVLAKPFLMTSPWTIFSVWFQLVPVLNIFIIMLVLAVCLEFFSRPFNEHVLPLGFWDKHRVWKINSVALMLRLRTNVLLQKLFLYIFFILLFYK